MRWIQMIALCAIFGSTTAWAQEWESLDEPSAPKVQMWCPICLAPMEAQDTRCPFGHEGITPMPVHLMCPLCSSATFVEECGAWRCTICGLPVKYVRRPVSLEAFAIASRDWYARSLHGKFAYQFDSYRASDPQGRHVQNDGRLMINLQTSIGRSAVLFFSPEMRLDDTDRADNDVTLDNRERHQFDVAEAYVEVRTRSGDLFSRIGKQKLSSARVEKASPLDEVMYPKDYLNILDDETIGVWAAFARWKIRNTLSVEGVIIPAFTPHRLPQKNNRWSFSPFDQAISTVPLAQAQGGLGLMTRIRSTEVRGRYFRTPARFPSLHLDPSALPSFVHSIEHVWGVDVHFPQIPIGTKGEITVKGEGTYTVGEGDGSDDLIRYALYADYTVEDVLRSRDQVRLAIEYVGATIRKEGEDIEYPRFFSDAWMGALEYYPTGQMGGTRFRVAGVWNASQRGNTPRLRAGDFLVRPEVSHDIGRWTVKVGGNWLHGSSESVFGRFEENSGIFMNVEFRFGGR